MEELSLNLSGLTTGIGGSSILTKDGSAEGLTPPKRSERADSACAMLPGDNPTLNELIGQFTNPGSTTSTYVDMGGSDLATTRPMVRDSDSTYGSDCESFVVPDMHTTGPSPHHNESGVESLEVQSESPSEPAFFAPPRRSATMEMKKRKKEEWLEACRNHEKHVEWLDDKCDVLDVEDEGKDGEIPKGTRWSYPPAGRDIRESLNFWRGHQIKAAQLKAAREAGGG
jgi:hypothetical protein